MTYIITKSSLVNIFIGIKGIVLASGILQAADNVPLMEKRERFSIHHFLLAVLSRQQDLSRLRKVSSTNCLRCLATTGEIYAAYAPAIMDHSTPSLKQNICRRRFLANEYSRH